MGNQSFINAIKDVKRAMFRFTYQSPSGVAEHGFKGTIRESEMMFLCNAGCHILPFHYVPWQDVASIEISEPLFPYKENIPTVTFYLK